MGGLRGLDERWSGGASAGSERATGDFSARAAEQPVYSGLQVLPSRGLAKYNGTTWDRSLRESPRAGSANPGREQAGALGDQESRGDEHPSRLQADPAAVPRDGGPEPP